MLKYNYTKTSKFRFYKTGIFPIHKHFLIFIIITFVIIFVYTCPSIYKSLCFYPLNTSKTCRYYVYNSTYPITKPVKLSNGISYKIAIISDLDQRSKHSQKSNLWYSIMKTGHLLWAPVSNTIIVTWNEEEIILSSSISMKGRGMEFSELVTFDGRLLTFDDRTGIVYSIEKDEIYPWVILMDGNGKNTKGFKSEWATVKDDQLYIGSIGKEWTSSSGEWEHNNPLWIKIISPRGEVQSVNWMDNYKILRQAINIDFPGYMIHESGIWSAVHKCWFFLPRKCSTHRYNETLDEIRSCNLLFRADENFSNIRVIQIGTVTPTKGFSSFKFLPGSNENIIISLKTEEYQNQMATYMMGFTVDGDIIMPEQKIALEKFEGFEFV
ncbi:soluble calcium-activated nucleotidase 1 [Leptopilina heterotoma]|uniref:soluble calcium-activated nucleotidase 1 n=1 Tax=Leptopilina heterotoma TaxID=63436 RepID=UPI001CA800F6|nr:soluble calcium-activated nucleotidase 1 [Leptopilina heterotoma]